MSRATASMRSPTRHCQMAECSESMGRSQPKAEAMPSAGPTSSSTRRASARARGMTRWPPATSVSLLAVATTLPAARAASTGRRLTTPPVATMTISTSSRTAIASIASGSASATVPAGRSRVSQRRPVGQRDDPGVDHRDLLGEAAAVMPGRQSHDLEGVTQRRTGRRASGGRWSRSIRAGRPSSGRQPSEPRIRM